MELVRPMTPTASDLAQMLTDARSRTLDLISDLSDEQLIGPLLSMVNPLLWEIGHVAWFHERWLLRHAAGEDPLWKDADSYYDSAAVAHDTRWGLHLPSRQETLDYMQEVLNRILDRTARRPMNDQEVYFCLLSVYHEDMHGEAFVYTRQTRGYSCPPCCTPDAAVADPGNEGGAPWPGDVFVPGGSFSLGSAPGHGFVFDNEKWAHPVEARPFRIARAPVTNLEFCEFVNDRGYKRRELWSKAGWTWRERSSAAHPLYWKTRDQGHRMCRRYDQIVPLQDHLPVIHVNWYEAEAYCRWAKRRLPTEAQWEMAASGEPSANGHSIAARKRQYPWGDEPPTRERANLDLGHAGCIPVNQLPAGDSAFGCRQMIGNVWEWTSTDFEPYLGFSVDPYKEYSVPWFGGTHKVLRGGAFATRSRMIRNNYRNFYTPDRRDVLAGFRTCSPDS